MSKNESMRISVPDQSVRMKWTAIEDVPFSEDEVFEIVQRYCDAQDHAKNYRVRAAAKAKLMKNKLAELAQQKGVSLEALLAQEVEDELES